MSLYNFEGIVDFIYSGNIDGEIPEKVTKLKQKLDLVESAKNAEEMANACAAFSEEEQSYINSPLLDHLIRTANTRDPLVRAVKYGYIDAIKIYLALGIGDIDAAIHWVFVQKSQEIIILLLEHGANHQSSFVENQIV